MPKNQGAPARANGTPHARGGSAAKKPRWSTDQRVAKGRPSERPRGGESTADRGASGNRAERRASLQWSDGSARSDRSDRSERPQRSERPERPAYGDRAERPQRSERPAYGNRTDRPERPSYGNRTDRPERDGAESRRPNWEPRGKSAPHGDRPQHDRAERSGRAGAPRQRSERDAERRDTSYGSYGRPERSNGYDRSTSSERRSFTPAEDVVHDRLEATSIEAQDVAGDGFSGLGLGDNIVRVLAELGATSPFAIQSGTIPAAIEGRDVLGRGRTGSGKTIAFGAPLVERLLRLQKDSSERRKPGRSPRALVLAPTRELALQIDATVQPIARSVGLFTTQIYGGVPFARQLGALERGVDIVIGTPGRIQDLAKRGALDLSSVEITVLDEADHMAELGFVEPVRELLRLTQQDGQRLLFSATLDAAVQGLIEEFLVNPAVFEVAGEDQASSSIDHCVLLIEQRDKLEILTELAAASERTIVFSRTRAYTEQLADHLDEMGLNSDAIHGDLAQARRQRALDRFTRGRTAVLVATDVAARGIHVDDIELVIQADAPDEHKAYLHRSGRTGRAGRSGTVVTLVPRNRRRRMEELLDRAGITASWISVRPGEAVSAVRSAASAK